METDDDLADLPLAQRVVLGVLSDLERQGATPAHTTDVMRAYADLTEAVSAETLGRLSEAEVNRALNRLEAETVVEMVEAGEQSAVGKGRPGYALAVETDLVLDRLADDDQLGSVLVEDQD